MMRLYSPVDHASRVGGLARSERHGPFVRGRLTGAVISLLLVGAAALGWVWNLAASEKGRPVGRRPCPDRLMLRTNSV
jgi:hypothetical protein